MTEAEAPALCPTTNRPRVGTQATGIHRHLQQKHGARLAVAGSGAGRDTTMVSIAIRPSVRTLTAADEAAIYEMLRSAPRTPAQVAAALRVEQMYIEQHLAFEA